MSSLTVYIGLEADSAIFETAVRVLVEGASLRAAAHIVQIDCWHLGSQSFTITYADG